MFSSLAISLSPHGQQQYAARRQARAGGDWNSSSDNNSRNNYNNNNEHGRRYVGEEGAGEAMRADGRSFSPQGCDASRSSARATAPWWAS